PVFFEERLDLVFLGDSKLKMARVFRVPHKICRNFSWLNSIFVFGRIRFGNLVTGLGRGGPNLPSQQFMSVFRSSKLSAFEIPISWTKSHEFGFQEFPVAAFRHT